MCERECVRIDPIKGDKTVCTDGIGAEDRLMSENALPDMLHLEIEKLKRRVIELECQNKELRDQKNRNESLFYDIPFAMAAVDETNAVISCNRRFEDLFQYKESEIRGKKLGECIGKPSPDPENDRTTGIDPASSRGEETVTRMHRKDGTPVDVERQYIPILLDGKRSGKYVLFHESVLNIFRLLTKVLPAIEHIFRAAPLSVGLHQDRVIKWISDKEPGILGYVREEITGRSTRFMYASDAEFKRVGQEQYLSIRERGFASLDVRFKKKDGNLIDAHIIVLPLDPADPEKGLVFMTQDITERKQAAEALRESEEKYRLLFDNAEVMVSVFDRDGVCLLMNRKVAELFGGEPSDFVGKPFAELHPEQDDTFIRDIKEIIDSGVAQYRQGEIMFPEGARWLSSRVHPLRDAKGIIYAVQIISEDITERKLAEETLKLSEKRYRELYESNRDGFVRVTMDGSIVESNTMFKRMLGYTEEELLDKTYENITPARWRVMEKQIIEEQVLPRGYSDVYEKEYIRKDGSIFPIEIRTHLLRDENKNPIGMWAFVRDVTERIRTERALRESEAKYRLLIKNARESIAVLQDGYVKFANEQIYALTGYTDEELRSRPFIDFAHPEDRKMVLENYQKRLRGENVPFVYEGRILHKDGSVRWCEVNAIVIQWDGEPSTLAFLTDVTERKLADIALRESEEKYRHLIEQSSQGITIMQGNPGVIVFSNSSMEKIHGYTREELLSFSADEAMQIFQPEDKKLVADRYLKRLRGEPVPEKHEVRGVHKDGSALWLEIHNSLIEFQGEPAVLSAFTDITERKRAEEALRESEEKYRELVENANSIILKMDLNGRITFYNEYARSFFGYPEEEVIGKSIVGVLTPVRESTGRDLEAFIRDLIANPERYRNHKNENLRRNGERVWVSWTNKVIQDKQGNKTGILAIGNDITEMKRLEDHLMQSQKMEAIGTLAGGIAHDFNNILSAIIGYAELANLDIQEGTQTKRNLNEMIKAALRAKELVTQILAFSRKDEQTLKPVDLRPVVEEILGMLRASLPSTIEIRKQIDSNVKNVNADTTQIHQVLLNLCTNASHAMEKHGGTLEVTLKNTFVDETMALQYPDAAQGPYVCLRVGDTGHGMAPDIMARIFDPYFTTKEKGMGTGMGLAVVHGIVNNHKGIIRVNSEPEKGTMFEILLPSIDEDPDERIQSAPDIPKGHETLLFVDDEPDLVEIGSQLLGRLGYHIVTCTKSKDALSMFKADPGRFDLVVTDMTMPKLTGIELAEQMTAIRPDIPIILCSGYEGPYSQKKVREIGIKAFIRKPIDIFTMAKLIREVLYAKEA